MNNAQPGGGLPSIEKNFIKWLVVPAVRLLFTYKSAELFLKRELRLIDELTRELTHEELNRQVLIDRAFAIEDHSRDYSVNMALEHLTIAGRAVQGVIKTLSAEKPFPREITIEAVKPKGEDKHAKAHFFEFMQNYLAFIKAHPKTQSKMSKAHPWFRKFNNADWTRFMFMHTFVHRRHIAAIIEKLRSESE